MSSPLFVARSSYPSSSNESDEEIPSNQVRISAVMENHSDGMTFKGLRTTKQPLSRIVGKVLLRWLLTVALSISIIVVLRTYSFKLVMSKRDKLGFNAIMMGLCIVLGLAIISSLNGMAGDLRWWILSRRYRSRRKVELILEAERVSRMLKLAFRSRRLSVHFAAYSGLLLLLATQIGVASLALCYSADSEDKTAFFSPGRVSVPDLSSIQTAKIVSSQSSSLGAQQYTANSYGTVSISYSTAGMAELPEAGTIWITDDPLIFCDMDCRYIFHEIATDSIADSDANPITVVTPRSIDTTTTCKAWPVVFGGEGTTNKITVSKENYTVVSMPIATGEDQTIFITNTSDSCGSGCSKISIFEASNQWPWFYDCNATVGQVTNATLSEHQVTENFTSMASAAIALQGYQATSLSNNMDIQYQIYPAASIFGTPANGSVQQMAFLISRFSTGVVAAAAINNNMLILSGMAPQLGSRLKVLNWNFIVLILILLVTIQLILGITSTMLANRVVIPIHSLVETAQVLKTMTNHHTAGNRKRLSTGDEKSKVLWIYKDTKVADGVYDLHMEDDRSSERTNA